MPDALCIRHLTTYHNEVRLLLVLAVLAVVLAVLISAVLAILIVVLVVLVAVLVSAVLIVLVAHLKSPLSFVIIAFGVLFIHLMLFTGKLHFYDKGGVPDGAAGELSAAYARTAG